MKYFYLFTCIIYLVSCKSGPPDGMYCAEVKYRHIRTGRNLTQKLLVEVNDRQLTKIVFPDDNADTSALIPQNIPDEGKVTVLSRSGDAYYVKMIGTAEKCSQAVNLVQCRGMKKNGERCQRLTDHPSGTCWQHRTK
jgi:hypothetical protein